MTLTNKSKLATIIKTAGEIVGRQPKLLRDLYSTAVHRKALFITGDAKLSLHAEFELLL